MSTRQRLFDKAKQITPESCAQGFEWLDRLEMSAQDGDQSFTWAYALRGYAAGLWAMDFISIETLDDFNKLLAEEGF